jgi:hypothetical protein
MLLVAAENNKQKKCKIIINEKNIGNLKKIFIYLAKKKYEIRAGSGLYSNDAPTLIVTPIKVKYKTKRK